MTAQPVTAVIEGDDAMSGAEAVDLLPVLSCGLRPSAEKEQRRPRSGVGVSEDGAIVCGE